MVFWKQLHNKTAGFTLIEVLVAITILGLVVVPIGSSLVLSYRLNARSGDTLQAQLAVSRAVETIMAEGFDPSMDDYDTRFPDVKIEHDCGDPCDAAHRFIVTAKNLNTKDADDLLDKIFVETYAREVSGDA
jgi:prepilin-type N-terminal cleavage/methylation domain-containing protein